MNDTVSEILDRVFVIIGIALFIGALIFIFHDCSKTRKSSSEKKNIITEEYIEVVKKEATLVLVIINDFENVNSNDSKSSISNVLVSKIGEVCSLTDYINDSTITVDMEDAFYNAIMLNNTLENRLLSLRLDTTNAYKSIIDSVTIEYYTKTKLQYVKAYSKIMNYQIPNNRH